MKNRDFTSRKWVATVSEIRKKEGRVGTRPYEEIEVTRALVIATHRCGNAEEPGQES